MKRLLIPAAVLALAVPAFAQVNPPVRPAQPPAQPPVAQPVQPAQPGQVRPAEKDVTAPTFRAKDVLGTKVSITGGTEIGTVDDLVFDDAGNLEYMIVENGGKLITVPWEAAKFDLGKKTATLPITAETYKTIPTYTPTAYPQFYTPTYRNEVYKWYGLTPRELRRIERRR